MPPHYYYGVAAILRPGDAVRPTKAADITSDPAEALANAWRDAEHRCWPAIPHVYEVTQLDGPEHIVMGDVILTGDLSNRARRIWRTGDPPQPAGNGSN